MIQVGDKFKVHWKGHESCYIGRLYQVVGFCENCTCGVPFYITGKPEKPRRPHTHIRAKLIEAPSAYMIGESGFTFGPLDMDTLNDIDTPEEYWLEIIRKKGDQLNLF